MFSSCLLLWPWFSEHLFPSSLPHHQSFQNQLEPSKVSPQPASRTLASIKLETQTLPSSSSSFSSVDDYDLTVWKQCEWCLVTLLEGRVFGVFKVEEKTRCEGRVREARCTNVSFLASRTISLSCCSERLFENKFSQIFIFFSNRFFSLCLKRVSVTLKTR